jgi:uncharacterized integral membrane protein
MWTFAKRGALFGGIGFAAGGAIQVMGRAYYPTPLIDYWEVMEFLLGAMLGAAFGSAAWRWRIDVARRPKADLPTTLTTQLSIAAGVVAWGLLVVLAPARASYTLAGIPLLLFATWYAASAWQIAITLTYSAFALDYHRAALASAPVVAWIAAQWRSARLMYLVLLASAVAISLLKALTRHEMNTTQAVFVVMALLCKNWLDHLPRDSGQAGVQTLIFNREA